MSLKHLWVPEHPKTTVARYLHRSKTNKTRRSRRIPWKVSLGENARQKGSVPTKIHNKVQDWASSNLSSTHLQTTAAGPKERSQQKAGSCQFLCKASEGAKPLLSAQRGALHSGGPNLDEVVSTIPSVFRCWSGTEHILDILQERSPLARHSAQTTEKGRVWPGPPSTSEGSTNRRELSNWLQWCPWFHLEWPIILWHFEFCAPTWCWSCSKSLLSTLWRGSGESILFSRLLLTDSEPAVSITMWSQILLKRRPIPSCGPRWMGRRASTNVSHV